MTDQLTKFYAEMTPLYHLIYPDWNESIARQSSMLDLVIHQHWGEGITTVLDASCGIGTQALGLASLGYDVTASDVSPEEIARAKAEATDRGVDVLFTVADMREAFSCHAREFDIVISCDNSMPHLLTDDDILVAFREFHKCTRPGGGCIVSVRDYDAEDLSELKVKPYGVREENGVRWVVFQVWEPKGSKTYDLTFYFVEDKGDSECRTHAIRSTYYAVGIPKLMEMMTEAGFEDVHRIDGRFFQPLIVGTKRA